MSAVPPQTGTDQGGGKTLFTLCCWSGIWWVELVGRVDGSASAAGLAAAKPPRTGTARGGRKRPSRLLCCPDVGVVTVSSSALPLRLFCFLAAFFELRPCPRTCRLMRSKTCPVILAMRGCWLISSVRQVAIAFTQCLKTLLLTCAHTDPDGYRPSGREQAE